MDIAIEHLRTLLRYDPETGVVTRAPHWKPVSLTPRGKNYAAIEVGGKRYAARRVVWALMTGEWPPNERLAVRLRNNDIYDLRWANLYRIPDGKRECASCRAILPEKDFYKNAGRKPGISSYCKPCDKENRDISEYNLIANTRRRGMTVEDYAHMLDIQGGLCAICMNPEENRKLSIDHCHETDKVRGLLCRQCNIGLGHFKDDPALLVAAAKYVLKHRV